MLLDEAIHVKIRDGKVANLPTCTAVAVATYRGRDILGLWAGDGGEAATFCLSVLTEIKNRGVDDAWMGCAMGSRAFRTPLGTPRRSP